MIRLPIRRLPSAVRLGIPAPCGPGRMSNERQNKIRTHGGKRLCCSGVMASHRAWAIQAASGERSAPLGHDRVYSAEQDSMGVGD